MKPQIIYRLKNLPKFILLLIVLYCNYGYACSCTEEKIKFKAKIKRDFSASDLIIIGRVIEIREPNKSAFIKSSADPIINVFELKQSFKGKIKSRIVEIVSAASGASCGYVFNLKEEYLVYARKADFFKNITQNKFDFTTGLCSRNQNVRVLNKKEKIILQRLKRKKLKNHDIDAESSSA